MAQINTRVLDRGISRESYPYNDDLTLRSFASKLMIINSDSSASNYKVFRIRKPKANGMHGPADDVSFITELGDATFNYLTANGNATLNGDVNIYGHTKIYDHLEVVEDVFLQNSINVSGSSSFILDSNFSGDIVMLNNASVCRVKNINVDYITNLTGSLNASGFSQFFGEVEFSSSVAIFDHTYALGGLSVTGFTDIQGDLAISSTLGVSGNAHCASGFQVDGDTVLQGLTVDQNLDVLGTSKFNQTASGYFDINDTFKISGVPTQTSVSASNLNTLTNGSNSDALHVHKANKDIDIVVASSGGDYTDLWSAYAAATAGQVILVTNNQTTAIQRTLDKQIEIIFKPSVKITCSTALASSVIIFGTDIITKNFNLELTQTGTTNIGFQFNGNTSYHDNIKLVMNDVSTTGVVSEAYVVNSGKKGNFARGLAQQISGTITTTFTDNSTNYTNDVSIRGIS